MTVDVFLSKVDGLRCCRHGWVARCPAHPDDHPSLQIRQGDKGILVKCWAGCSLEEVVSALGLRQCDLFYGMKVDPHVRQYPSKPSSKPRRFDWRRYAGQLEDEALSLWLRRTAVLEAARWLDITAWTDQELDDAMEVIASTHEDFARSRCFEELAFNLRTGGLREEHDGHQPRC